MVVYGGQQYYPQHERVQHEQMDVDVPLLFRRSYKRPWPCEPFRASKRSRRDTGIGHIHTETENTRIYELDQMQNRSSPIYFSTTGYNCLSNFLPADKSSSINYPGCESISSNNPKSSENDMEYERMLFETHGCTAYHHQRAQLLSSDHIETEF